jgi:cysteine desulfurase/selenocysteine lyase
MTTHPTLDIAAIRREFPILEQKINDHPLIYLDNAATTQKPRAVIQSLLDYYQEYNSNVHRSVHGLGERATLEYERVRDKIKRFIHASKSKECIFTSGATESINLVAQSYLLPQLSSGDEILITHLEHHSNIVPWQLICERTDAKIVVAPINHDGEVMLDDFKRLLNAKTKFVAISHISNALGSILPIKEMIALAKEQGATVLIDGAQAAPHTPLDVQALGCDFYAFSAHKMYGPTGVGVLWGREALLERMSPYQGGGEMIASVTFAQTEYAPLPHKFEAGTPNIAGVIGFGHAIDYLTSLGLEEIEAYELHLLRYATESIRSIKGFNIVGTAKDKASIISFVHGTVHAHDIGTILNSMGIAIRSGHHCAMPVMDRFELAATARVSFSFYNTEEEIDALARALHKVKEVFA